MRKIDVDFDKIVEIFNSEGKQVAKEYVENTYNCSYPNVQRRIKEETKNIEISNEDSPDFRVTPQSDDMFKDIVSNLMKDKIQEISKYIHLEQSTKLVLISLKKLEQNGYKVILD